MLFIKRVKDFTKSLFLVSILCMSWSLSSFSYDGQLYEVSPQTQVAIFSEEQSDALYELAADQFIATLKTNPKAVILLPTGSSPEKLYSKLVDRFTSDSTLDWSKAQFFNLDEYTMLPKNHPLSYAYYMETLFFGPLRKVEPKRAPQPDRIHIPEARINASRGAKKYQQHLEQAIEENPKKAIDLAIVGVGGAYPDPDSNELQPPLKGGHIAFNEPGSDASTKIRVVPLTEKTRRDTRFRFSSLRALQEAGTIQSDRPFLTEVPLNAVSMGLQEVLRAEQILVLALGESKAPVIDHVFNHPVSSDFPASFLAQHRNCLWLLDEFAAISLVKDQWKNLSPKTSKSIQDTLRESFSHLAVKSDFMSKVQQQAPSGSDPTQVQEEYRRYQDELRHAASPENLPRKESILIVSPHPDDDVISMGATLHALNRRGNTVHVVYAVGGANSVRTSEPRYATIYESFKKKNPLLTETQLDESIKSQIRSEEALAATTHLGLQSHQLHFLDADYYRRRGVPGISPISESDVTKMLELLLELQPTKIFFAAENDPHGAHGLSAELLARAIPSRLEPEFFGYRGAYNEWPLMDPKTLLVHRFSQEMMNRKIESIKLHRSQLDPLFPSFDPRPFFQRAYDRNENSGKIIEFHLETKESSEPFAEVFRRYTKKEFLQRHLDS